MLAAVLTPRAVERRALGGCDDDLRGHGIIVKRSAVRCHGESSCSKPYMPHETLVMHTSSPARGGYQCCCRSAMCMKTILALLCVFILQKQTSVMTQA